MLSFPTVAASLALIASVSALPTATSNAAGLEARGYVDCPSGYWYSKCGVHDGCFNYDPCSGQTPPPPPPPSCTPGRVIGPQFIDLQVRVPDAPMSSTSGNLMALFRDDSSAHRFQDQVAQFHGIPKEAKQCTIGWRQNGSPSRTFGVLDAAGRVSYQVLPSLPAPVTYNAVRALVPADAPERSIDFTNWDILPNAYDHMGGDIPCAESIYVYLTLTKDIKQGGVFLQGVDNAQGSPDLQQGVFVSYTC